jgi:hypothetical protein
MIIGGTCYSFKRELLEGLHQSTDEYKLALFTGSSFIGPAVVSYSGQVGEVTGPGYVAGGKPLSGFKANLDGETAFLDFDDLTWANSTITSRGGLIYNSTRENRAVAVIDFGRDITSTNGPFKVEFPAPDVEHAFLVLD